MIFYLGTHMPCWLASMEVPLFISHRRLRRYRRLPIARQRWALDSGGFSELRLFGGWNTTPESYCASVARYVAEIGRLDFAAQQDWMCEPEIRRITGFSTAGHQARTVQNYLQLVEIWPEHSDAPCPFIPVLQGWDCGDYLQCLDLFGRAGVDLAGCPVVGLGSVCRRQSTTEIAEVTAALAPHAALHGFGVKGAGLAVYGDLLTSADSLAWSFGGRRLPGCSLTHKTEANCRRHALAWRARAMARLPNHEIKERAA